MIIPEAWKVYVFGGAAACVLAVGGWLVLSRARLQVELAEVKGHYVVCQNVNEDWAVKAAAANAAVEKMKAEEGRRLVLSIEAAKKAKIIVSAHQEKARKVMRAKASANECESVRDLMESYVKKESGAP